jgi:hypothetical protein
MTKKPFSRRWKNDPKRAKTFAVRALKWTRLSITRIGRLSGNAPGSVRRWNGERNIRSSDRAKEIWRESLVEANARRKPPRVNAYSEREKLGLLAKATRGIKYRAWENFRQYSFVRLACGNDVEELISDATHYAFGQLDWFDPYRIAKRTGRPILPSTYILESVNQYCRGLMFKEARRKRKQEQDSHGLDLGDFVPAHSQRPERTKPTLFQMAQVPLSTRSFFRALGMDVNTVALDGLAAHRKTILRVANHVSTGLTPREKNVVEARLDGKSFKEIAPLVSGPLTPAITKERARQIQKSAIRKIRASMRSVLGPKRND